MIRANSGVYQSFYTPLSPPPSQTNSISLSRSLSSPSIQIFHVKKSVMTRKKEISYFILGEESHGLTYFILWGKVYLLLFPCMEGLMVMMVSPLAFRTMLDSLLSPTDTASCSCRSLAVVPLSKTSLWTCQYSLLMNFLQIIPSPSVGGQGMNTRNLVLEFIKYRDYRPCSHD